jgi:hypothetical protein
MLVLHLPFHSATTTVVLMTAPVPEIMNTPRMSPKEGEHYQDKSNEFKRVMRTRILEVVVEKWMNLSIDF